MKKLFDDFVPFIIIDRLTVPSSWINCGYFYLPEYYKLYWCIQVIKKNSLYNPCNFSLPEGSPNAPQPLHPDSSFPLVSWSWKEGGLHHPAPHSCFLPNPLAGPVGGDMELGLVLNSSCYEFFRWKFLRSQLDSIELAVEVIKVKSQHTSSIPGIHWPWECWAYSVQLLTSHYVLEPHAVACLWGEGLKRNL